MLARRQKWNFRFEWVRDSADRASVDAWPESGELHFIRLEKDRTVNHGLDGRAARKFRVRSAR